jgi:hypothetical protein
LPHQSGSRLFDGTLALIGSWHTRNKPQGEVKCKHPFQSRAYGEGFPSGVRPTDCGLSELIADSRFPIVDF